MVTVAAAFLCLAPHARAASPVPLILDTDMFSNADDVGALASAFALQRDGEANVIAVTVNTRTDRPAVATDSWRCVAAIAGFYGYPAIPVGAHMPDDGSDTGPGPDGSSSFTAKCAALAPASTPAPAPAVSVLRRALVSQPDDSVVLVEIGYQQNLADLLQSPPDAISPLSGAQLVAGKVRVLVAMGGWFPSSQGFGAENNLGGDPASAQYVAADWPTKIVWSGAEVGGEVATGWSLPSAQPANSPVRVAYQAFVDPQYRDGPNIPSYDLTAVYHAVRPADPALSEAGPGINALDQWGNNTFTASPSADQYYLTLPSAPALEVKIEGLLGTLPPAGTVSGTVVDASTHAPIGGVQVQADDPLGDLIAETYTAADGTYTLSGLYAGTYTVTFIPGSGHQPGVHKGGVLLGAGATVSGVNGSLTGTRPASIAKPSISGVDAQGQTLTESHGTWTNDPTAYAYHWQDCSRTGASCSPIAGATAQTYLLTTHDVGHTIRVKETATNAGGTSAPARSPATRVVRSAQTDRSVPVAAPAERQLAR